jgi:hypothetical protein
MCFFVFRSLSAMFLLILLLLAAFISYENNNSTKKQNTVLAKLNYRISPKKGDLSLIRANNIPIFRKKKTKQKATYLYSHFYTRFIIPHSPNRRITNNIRTEFFSFHLCIIIGKHIYNALYICFMYKNI